MDFTLSDEQEMLRDTARQLMARECPASLVRAHIGDPAVAEALWKHLREWTALAGRPLVDLCLFLEETGAALAPGPFFATTALFAPLLRAIGHPLLDDVLAGEVTGTVAMADAAGRWVPNGEPIKRFVPEAERADWVAVVADGPAVLVVERPPAQALKTVDWSRRLAELDTTALAGDAVNLDAEVLRGVVDRATVALAAEMLGTTRWILEATLDYAKQRVQFDRPIGSFQAVKHKLADMALAHERAWSAVYSAAMLVDAEHPDRHRAAHTAKAAAGEAAKRCAKDGIQIHGGIGYTWEHDLHLYIRRAYSSEHLLGTSQWHHDRLGELLLR